MFVDVSGTLSDFTLVFGSLRQGLGRWAAQGLISHVVALLVYGRLGRAEQQIARLMALFQAGRLRWRVGVVLAPARVADARVLASRDLPVQFAWLVRQARWEAAVLGSQLQQVLIQPEMVALLRACPQVRRVLAPVCRMLAISGDVLRPIPEGFVAPAARESVAKVKRVRVPRVPMDWGRIALPVGVLTAARRAGFKSVR